MGQLPPRPPNDFPDAWTTVARVPVSRILAELQRPYPAEAWQDLPKSTRGAKRSVRPDAVKARVREVFGVWGAGWKLTVHTSGGTDISYIPLKDRDGKEYFVWGHSARMVQFEYLLLGPSGEREWQVTGYVSAYSENDKRAAAERSIEGVLLKYVMSIMAGFPTEGGQRQSAQADNSQRSAPQSLQRPSERPVGRPMPLDVNTQDSGPAADNGPIGPSTAHQTAPGADPAWDEAGLKIFMAWAKTYGYSEAQCKVVLGIKARWSEWEHGYKAAQTAILEDAGRGIPHDRHTPDNSPF